MTNLSVACGVVGATITNYWIEKDFNIAMIGNGAIAGAVAITAPSGYVEPWAAVPRVRRRIQTRAFSPVCSR